MKKLVITISLLISASSYAATDSKSESFNKVKNVYISHMQQKIIYMSEMTSCMAKGMSFKDLKSCSDDGKAKIAVLDKKAHAAHVRAQKKKSKK